MALRVTKTEAEDQADMVVRLREGGETLVAAYEAFNAKLSEARDELNEAIAAYNDGILTTAREFVEGVVARLDDEINAKSEKWQDSDKGRAAQEWKAEWEALDLTALDITLPDDIGTDAPEHADPLEAIASEPEQVD